MRRDDDILGIPQRIVLRQRLRIHDVERGTAQLAVVQRLDQSGLVDDLAARGVDDEGAAAGENVEFGSAEQVRRRGRQGQGYDQHVEVLGQERVQVGFVGGRARVPGDGDRAVRVAGAGDVVTLVGAGGGRRAWGGGVGEDVCAEGGKGAGHCGVGRVSLGNPRPTGDERGEKQGGAGAGEIREEGLWDMVECWVCEDLPCLPMLPYPAIPIRLSTQSSASLIRLS
jgi:hypothetical protein